MYRFRDTLPIDISEQTISGDLVTIENPEEMGVVDALEVSLEPIQDLNGYDAPWVGGAGKNKLQVTASSQTVNGVTFTVNADGSVKVNGTATANTSFALVQRTAGLLASGNYLLNGNANLDSQFLLQVYSFTKSQNIARCTSSADASFSVDANEELMVVLYVFSGKTVNNLTVYPMIRLASVSDATFEPYSNICPISGRTEVVTWDDPKYGGTVAWNQLGYLRSSPATSNGVTFTVVNNTITTSGTATGGTAWTSSFARNVNIIKNHKYVMYGCPKNGAVNTKYCVMASTANVTGNPADVGDGKVFVGLADGITNLSLLIYEGFNSNGLVFKPQIHDLTAMFGTTIADHIYSLEQATAGAGVAWFRKLFPKPYYAYNAGETTCVSAVNGDPYNHYTTDLGRTVYGGTLDVTSGVLTVTHATRTFDGTEDWKNPDSSGICWLRDDTLKKTSNYEGTIIASTLPTARTRQLLNNDFECGISGYEASGADNYWYIKAPNQTTQTATALKAWLQANNVQACYELATPQTYQLTPQQIDLLLGTNHLWSDGEISAVWHKDLTKGRTLPTEAVSINGQYIENVLDGYRTLYTKGRESLGAELNTYSVGTADGEKFKNKRYPARELTIGFQLIADNPQEFRNRFNALNNLLSIEEADFIFNDETDKFFSGYPIMNAEVEAGQNSVKGEWKIYCAYPFKRSVEPITLTMEDATVTDTTATFTIDYKGARPARPVLRAKFAGALSGGSSSEDGDCGFVAFVDQEENIIQLGNPEVLDLDEYTKAETLINKSFVNISDWTRTGGHTYKGTVTGSVSTSNTTDTYWNGGRGQTQSYAKPSYGSGSGLHGAILWKNTAGAVNFTMHMVHRLCVSSANQTGVFECGAYNHDTGVMVAGFVIDKTSNGTAGVVRYIVNGVQVGSDSIDLSYYNTHFGYCNRTPVYVQQTYYDPVTETYRVQVKTKKKKKKKKKYVTKSRIVWVARTRTVFSNWNYTQSNLNSSIEKEGAYVYIKVGNLPLRTFNVPDVEQMIAHDASVFMGTYGTAMHTNMIHSLLFRREAGVPFAEQPNVFTAGDIVEADCNEATVNIYRDGSIGGHLEPQYGALGNDWESFMLTSGSNVIRATWSEWVNPTYKPQIEIEYNEVFI